MPIMPFYLGLGFLRRGAVWKIFGQHFHVEELEWHRCVIALVCQIACALEAVFVILSTLEYFLFECVVCET